MAEQTTETTATEATGEAFATTEDAGPTSQGQASTNGTEAGGDTSAFHLDGQDGDTNSDADAGSEKEGEDQGGAPEKYEDFTLPEGWTLPEDRRDAFASVAKEANLNQAQAQKIVDLYVKTVEGDVKARQDGWASISQEWTQASKTAGLLKPDVMSHAQTALKDVDKDGSLGRVLFSLGLDKHPGILRVFEAYGKSISSPTSIPTGGTAGDGKADRSAILYPNMKKE